MTFLETLVQFPCKICLCVFSNCCFGVFECSLLHLQSKSIVTFLFVHGRKQTDTDIMAFNKYEKLNYMVT